MAGTRVNEDFCADLGNLYRTIKQIWSKGGTRLFKLFVVITMVLYMLFCAYLLTVLLKDDSIKLYPSKWVSEATYVEVNQQNLVERSESKIEITKVLHEPGFELGKRGDEPSDTNNKKIRETIEKKEVARALERLAIPLTETPIVITEETKIYTTTKIKTSTIIDTTAQKIDAVSTERNIVKQKTLKVEAYSSKNRVYVLLNSDIALDVSPRFQNETDRERGIHCIVLNQFTGVLIAHKVFDTFIELNSELLLQFVESIQNGRVIILTVFDEGSFNFLKKERIVFAKKYGSRKVEDLDWRNSWVFAFKKGAKQPYAEDFHGYMQPKHSEPSRIRFEFDLVEDNRACVMSHSPKAELWKKFCSENVGFGRLCDCKNPEDVNIAAPSLESIQAPGHHLPNNVAGIPIAVIGGNRPHYLYRMLSQLLQTPGVDRKMVNVFIDGNYTAPNEIAQLFGIAYQTNPHQCERACAIQQNYKHSLTSVFDKYPHAKYAIILEEDLKVAVDLMDYFSQTIPLLETDESLFCVSAWNDNGYSHSIGSPTMLYRIETMPGLGWVLKRKIYKNELESAWPKVGQMWDWDMWVRAYMLNARECVIPDVSRTFHFGKKGVNMSPYFHKVLFQTHALNNQTGNIFNISTLVKDNYEAEMHRLISSAQVLNHTKNPCKDKDFIPDTVGGVYVVYIRYKRNSKTERTWQAMANCFHIWTLDDRGFHKLMVRLYLKQNMVFVVGSRSPYAVHKPKDIVPISGLKG